MSNITLFNFEGSPVRVSIDEKGEPWFVAKDVAEALGATWNGDARVQHVPDRWRRVTSDVTLLFFARLRPLYLHETTVG